VLVTDLKEGLAKFGYRLERKVEKFRNSATCWRHARTYYSLLLYYYLNMAGNMGSFKNYLLIIIKKPPLCRYHRQLGFFFFFFSNSSSTSTGKDPPIINNH
jgi:hypothetical protein